MTHLYNSEMADSAASTLTESIETPSTESETTAHIETTDVPSEILEMVVEETSSASSETEAPTTEAAPVDETVTAVVPASEAVSAPAEAIAPVLESSPSLPESVSTIVAGVDEIVAPAPTDPTKPVIVISLEEIAKMEAESQARKDEAAKKKAEQDAKKKILDEVFEKVKGLHGAGQQIEVKVEEKIKGGLRVSFEDLRMFMPMSQAVAKKNPTDEELKDLVGQTVKVNIHELNVAEDGKKTVVVSRKKIAEEQLYSSIKVGDVVEGKVVSTPSFGVFVDLGSLEGLIHVSRLAQTRVEDPSTMFKKGDTIKCSIIEIDRAKGKIALSHREFAESPYKGLADQFPVGALVRGKVRRIQPFGAFVQLRPGIDGLCRCQDMSWTKRVQTPDELFKVGDEADFVVIEFDENRKSIALSFKLGKPNPWATIADTLPIGSETNGVVQSVLAQGAVVRINDTFDGFMPKRRMGSLVKGNRMEVTEGMVVECVVVDFDPAKQSLIVATKDSLEADQDRRESGGGFGNDRGGERRDRGDRNDRSGRGGNRNEMRHDKGTPVEQITASNINILELLSDEEKTRLMGTPPAQTDVIKTPTAIVTETAVVTEPVQAMELVAETPSADTAGAETTPTSESAPAE